jgi:C-terminal processing protease CtpA/Prc
MRKISLLLFALLLVLGCNRKEQKVEYLYTFAKAYGYVKYFHPSDEAAQIDWKQFAVYGAEKVEECKSTLELIGTLNELFKPIAPTVIFSSVNGKVDFDFDHIKPKSTDGYGITFWQHRGVGFGTDSKYQSLYSSTRVNRDTTSKKTLFDYHPSSTEIIEKDIGSGIVCQIPIVLYFNEEGTYQKVSKESFNALKEKLIYSSISPQNLAVRIGNVVNTFNVFQHFYPYFDVIDIDWEDCLRKALRQSFSDSDFDDHTKTLQKFTSHLRDGHIYFYGSKNNFIPQISWEWVENQLVITRVFEPNLDLSVGDVVTRINGVKPRKYFDEIESRISAGTSGNLKYKAKYASLLGPEGTKIKIRVNNETKELVRNKDYYSDRRLIAVNQKEYDFIGDSIAYLNLDIISMTKINKLLPRLEQCNAIICDLRGYPNGNHEFITHLLSNDDTTQAWMRIPNIVYPDQERIVGYDHYNWMGLMKVREPYLGDKKIIFIIDGRAISYAESYLGYIEGYRLATIIGQPSAGTNGNVNAFSLSGGLNIMFTGMKVLKHDGSQHHGTGIIPDVYLTKTIKGVKEGRDEFLERAMEIAHQN